jgi:hypothetical protein
MFGFLRSLICPHPQQMAPSQLNVMQNSHENMLPDDVDACVPSLYEVHSRATSFLNVSWFI